MEKGASYREREGTLKRELREQSKNNGGRDNPDLYRKDSVETEKEATAKTDKQTTKHTTQGKCLLVTPSAVLLGGI